MSSDHKHEDCRPCSYALVIGRRLAQRGCNVQGVFWMPRQSPSLSGMSAGVPAVLLA